MPRFRGERPKTVVVHLSTADTVFDMCLHVDEKVRSIDWLLPQGRALA
jgi:hypothetical protein